MATGSGSVANWPQGGAVGASSLFVCSFDYVRTRLANNEKFAKDGTQQFPSPLFIRRVRNPCSLFLSRLKQTFGPLLSFTV